jgi:exodeoxyribonuclease VII small subunit
MSEPLAGDLASSEPSFENALKRLEDIVHSLEDGKLGLAEALERYEEGVKLLRQSYDLLQRAERKIELLSGIDAEGNPITQPFDDSATFNPAEPTKRRTRRRLPSIPPECGPEDRPSMDEP